jgi:tRNA-(ms[2]io[6]A)-hydroxylase
MARPTAADIPLRLITPPEWAPSALQRPLVLLNDHAHLEKKAATNALELLHRWPEPSPPENWVRALTAIARDEVDHLAVVTRLLARRGGRLTKHHSNGYAKDLRRYVRSGAGRDELVDRLITAALIEDLYRELVVADVGHYRLYVDLAGKVASADAVERRWSEWLDIEAEVIRAQPPGPRMHSWPPDDA